MIDSQKDPGSNLGWDFQLVISNIQALVCNFGFACFAVKYFSKNVFSIYMCLFHCKMLVNRKSFPLTGKFSAKK